MTAIDEEFERELLMYSEIETVTEPSNYEVPETIRRYRQMIAANNTASIFDQDYTMSDDDDREQKDTSSNGEHLADVLFKDEDKVIRVISGRGRGGRNVYQRPGDVVSKEAQDELVIQRELRKAAPLGYGNHITELAVKAHHNKAKQSQLSTETSPAVSKPASPFTTPQKTVVTPETNLDLDQNGAINKLHVTSSEASISLSRNSESYVSDSESYVESQNISEDAAAPDVEESVGEPHVAKPIPPMSELLRQTRENRRQQQRQQQRQQEEMASQLKIKEILEQDRLSDRSSVSSKTSSRSRSRDDALSWRQRTNSPPRATWGAGWRSNQGRSNDSVNINSVMEFPPLRR